MKQMKQAPREEVGFTKAQLLCFARYQNRRDLLEALLKEGQSYTMEEADELVRTFLKGKGN